MKIMFDLITPITTTSITGTYGDDVIYSNHSIADAVIVTVTHRTSTRSSV